MKLTTCIKKIQKDLHYQFRTFIYRKDLRKLLPFYDSKWNPCLFGERYQQHFSPLRTKKLKILEIGVGGYNDPQSGGSSLKMWKKYFPNSLIYGIDIVDKSSLQENRIKIFQGSQDDEYFLKEVIKEVGELDVIIDDGSHRNSHVIKSFKVLFPVLKSGGIYVVEDTHTSYIPSYKDFSKFSKSDSPPHWAEYGGSLDLYENSTMINFFKRLVDCLSHQEFINPGYSPNYFDKNVVAIHFYRNQIFIYKGDNTGSGNVVKNNTLRPEWLKEIGINSIEELGLEFPNIDDPTEF